MTMQSRFATGKWIAAIIIALIVPSHAQPPQESGHDKVVAILQTIRRQELSPRQAFDKKILTRDIIIYVVGEPALLDAVPLLWNPGEEIMGFTALLVEQWPELVERPGNWNTIAKIRIGQYFARSQDSRSAVFLESALSDIKPLTAATLPVVQEDNATIYAILNSLSGHYRSLGENEKAAKTALKIFDYTRHPDYQAALVLQAARSYHVMHGVSSSQKAKELYAQAIALGYGWATAHALADQARHAFGNGLLDEGRALLRQPFTGRYAEQMRILLNDELSKSYFSTGEWKLAREAAQAAVTQYESVDIPTHFQELDESYDSSKYRLPEIDDWEATPVRILTKEVRLRPQRKELLHTIFSIQSFRRFALTATCDNPYVTLHKVRSMPGYDVGDSIQTILIEIAAQNIKEEFFSAEIILTSKDFPGKQWRVPVEFTFLEADVAIEQ